MGESSWSARHKPHLAYFGIHDDPKIMAWEVRSNHSGDNLGDVRWSNRLHKFVIIYQDGTIMDTNCHDDLNTFMIDQTLQDDENPVQHQPFMFTEYVNTGKTKKWKVVGNESCNVQFQTKIIGVIKWYGAWRKYVMQYEGGTAMTIDGHKNINQFIKDQMDARKKVGK